MLANHTDRAPRRGAGDQAQVTGADLATQIRQRASQLGEPLCSFVRPLSPHTERWMRQLAQAGKPKPHTIARVHALLKGQPVPAPPPNGFQAPARRGERCREPAAIVRHTIADEDIPEPIVSDPCFCMRGPRRSPRRLRLPPLGAARMSGLIIDNFAGGGGASTGIEAALGRPIDVAINHDAEAVAMHVANHPDTHHFCQSIMAIDPREACTVDGHVAKVRLAWFSPDCKHHSKAKGGKPREKNIRDLAWVVVHWPERLGDNAPDVIALENVEEFRQWGPLDAEGKPIPERKGEEFDLWIRRLKRCGYKVEFRQLRACDYGAPTSRNRLYLIARRDKQPIRWPAPSHGKPGSPEVLSGQRKPWRTAAECIDWSIPCPSIFTRARPLKDTTLRRIAHGTMRYVVHSTAPFIVGTAFTSTRASRAFDTQDPLRTATAQQEYAVVDAGVVPIIVSVAHGDSGGRREYPIGDPLGTVSAGGIAHAVVDAGVVPITHSGVDGRAHSPAEPLRTITTANGGEFARITATLAPHITKFRGGAIGSDVAAPMPTVTANGSPARPAGAQPLALASATLITMGYGERPGQEPRVPGLDQPARTIVAGGGKHGLVTTELVEAAFVDRQFGRSLGAGADEPIGATTAGGGGKSAAVTAFLSHFYTSNTNGGQGSPERPAKTITSEGQHHALVCAHIEQANGGPRNSNLAGRPATAPISTVTATGSQQRIVQTTMIEEGALPPEQMERAVQVAAFLVKYYGSGESNVQPADRPLDTVTTLARFAVVTVTIDAVTYVIVDIGMRMLTPRELARAQGFPDSYILDPIGPNGKPLSKAAQIRMIGNSVCPNVAEAIVRENLPEDCALAQDKAVAA